jgi:hypothetical protein
LMFSGVIHVSNELAVVMDELRTGILPKTFLPRFREILTRSIPGESMWI